MHKSTVLILIILILIFCGLSVFFVFGFKPKQILKIDAALQRDHQAEENLKRDLEEKYRADLISYQVMSKRLELEKNKQKELKEKIMEAGIKAK